MKANEIKLDLLYSFPKEATIVIGCSSGPDSMALLHLLLEGRKEKQYQLVCAHVNHNVRRESVEEAHFLEEYCEQHQVQFESMVIEKYSDDNFHNEARTIRYQFFDAIVKKYHADYLVTAHHGDDLIETILMRIVRGSTLSGYAGFHPEVQEDGYLLVRPLIHLTKEEILAYDEFHKVPYRLDRTNEMPKYTRNRYRKVVLPFLKEEDSKVHDKFYQFSEELEAASGYIEKETAKAFSKVYRNAKVDLKEFLALDPFLARQVLYRLLKDVYQDDLILLSRRHIDLVEQLIRSRKQNSEVYLPNDIVVRKSYDILTIEKIVDQVDAYEIEFSEYAYLPNHHRLERIQTTDDRSNNVCRLNSEELAMPLIVRTRKLGDRMAVKHLGGTKKLKEIFIEAKVPMKDRDLYPIVTDSKGEIVFLPGLKKSKFDKNKNEKYDIIIKYY